MGHPRPALLPSPRRAFPAVRGLRLCRAVTGGAAPPAGVTAACVRAGGSHLVPAGVEKRYLGQDVRKPQLQLSSTFLYVPD